MNKTITILIIVLLTSSSVFSQDNDVVDLKIRGNKKLKTSFIKKITKVEVGERLDSLLLEEDIRRLKRLPLWHMHIIRYFQVGLMNTMFFIQSKRISPFFLWPMSILRMMKNLPIE